MTIWVFPMAGASSRFVAQGYNVPKYELPILGGAVFDYAISGFRRYFGSDTFVFVCRAGSGAESYVRSRCLAMGLPNPVVISLESTTRGQAETIALGLQRLSGLDNEELYIFNIDTIRFEFVKRERRLAESVGYLETFVGEGDNWSFIRPGPRFPEVLEVREKKRISKHCCTGLYYFASVSVFMETFDQYAALPVSTWDAAELYVAPMYNLLIDKGKTVEFDAIEWEDVAFCGIPSEYEEILRSPGRLMSVSLSQ